MMKEAKGRQSITLSSQAADTSFASIFAILMFGFDTYRKEALLYNTVRVYRYRGGICCSRSVEVIYHISSSNTSLKQHLYNLCNVHVILCNYIIFELAS